jgi:flagellar biosynthesis protein FlhA
VEHTEQNSHLSASPEAIRDVLGRLSRAISKPDGPTVVLVSSAARYFMRQISEGSLPNLVFIAHNEVPAEIRVVNLGLVK